MSFNAEKLYRLLPAIHRLRDQNGMGTLADNPTPGALKELIAVIADQVSVLEEELEQLYENQFVETAAPWALPYLGELLGLRGLEGPNDLLAPRAEVANTIGYRRRKGTAAMLEQLARDIMQQPAAGVEFWSRLASTQHVNHVRVRAPRANIAWASVRDAKALEFIGTPFEHATRTVEVRRIEPGLGRWNIPNIGLFVWRLRDQTRTRSPLAPSHLDELHLRLHPLGLDVPLCARPEPETDIAHLTVPENVPVLLTRRLFAGRVVAGAPNQFHPGETWYGPGRSVQLWRINSAEWTQISADEIVVCDLHDITTAGVITRWAHDDATFDGKKKILLDPMRGRVVLPEPQEVFASFSTLFPADLGGGEYARVVSFAKASTPGRFVAQQPVENSPSPPHTTVAAALAAGTSGDVIIEVRDSGHYLEVLPAWSAQRVSLELRAADGRWPSLTLTAPWTIGGDAAGSITLNGFFLSGQGITVSGDLGRLSMQHCTLLPGLVIGANGRLDVAATRPVALTVTAAGTELKLENCILGPLRVGPDVSVRLHNCIIDAGAPDAWAIAGTDDGKPSGVWRMENCTIIGRVAARGLELASNTIFLGDTVTVERRQEGCVRFCSLPADAVVPRRHKCVPRVEKDDEDRDVAIEGRPQFLSLRFADAAYCQLSRSTPGAIRLGADDDSEMGVYHDLMEPRREAHLRHRLRDYLRFGLEAGIFFEAQTARTDGITT